MNGTADRATAGSRATDTEPDAPQGQYSTQELAALACLSLGNWSTTQVSSRSRCDETMDAIKSYILRERLQPGDVLPTETQLCDTIGASRRRCARPCASSRR